MNSLDQLYRSLREIEIKRGRRTKSDFVTFIIQTTFLGVSILVPSRGNSSGREYYYYRGTNLSPRTISPFLPLSLLLSLFLSVARARANFPPSFFYLIFFREDSPAPHLTPSSPVGFRFHTARRDWDIRTSIDVRRNNCAFSPP